jgi:hypothetical protein
MRRYLTFPYIVRIGLACVFLANSLTAFLAPSEFQDLVSQSFLAGLLPISAASFVVFIGFNDGLVALVLLTGWHTARVAAYASLWFVGVILVIGAVSLDALEHLGFLAMSIALVMRGEHW